MAPVIEGFRVLENLGRGATSSVWKAEQISLNRLVVIKVLSNQLTHEPEDVALFKAEARLAANFKHPGIVQVYDFGQSITSRCYYFVMEYISGYSVGDWIRRKGKVTEAESLVIVHSVAEALKYAWDLSRIVHCDIKPDNIMVDGDGTIKVADLGLAHTVQTMSNQPGADANEAFITGTPNYMAPEQVRGLNTIDCRTDIYALGVSLYHMVTGQLPFDDSPPDIVLDRQLNETFEHPQKVNPDLSLSITQLILKMTAKDPVARFQNWDEVLTEVVRLERQMRKQAADAALVERSPAGDVLKDGNLVGNVRHFSYCPYCGKPVQPQALYCGFCGKPMVVPPQEQVEDQKQATIRLKPIPANLPASTPKSMASSVSDQPDVPPLTQRSRNISGRKHLSRGGNVSMMLSLCLLAFLGYYAYQKIKYNNDVIVSIKASAFKFVQTLPETKLWAFFMSQSAGAPGQSAVEPKPAPQQTASADTTKTNEPSPEVREAVPEAKEAVPEVKSDSVAEAAASSGLMTNAEPAATASVVIAVSAKSTQEQELDRLLAQCKQQVPKTGELVKLTFNNHQQKVEVILDHVTAEGAVVKVPSGFVTYPFRIMSEESRLMFFPEERARHIQGQQVKKSE